MRDILGYEGKTVVITGCATGMGAAAAELLVELGAEVHALDVQDVQAAVKQSIAIDLQDQASIDAALPKLPDRIDSIFHCAGVPGPPRFSALQTMLVNFIGPRHLGEALEARIVDGGAIASITSLAGMGYSNNMEKVNEFLATPDFASARAWCEANPDTANGYLFSKQAIIAYTKTRAAKLLEREIRINCLSPAPTDTPMLPSFHNQVSKEFIEEHFLSPVGRNATAAEMGDPLVFLNSHAARFISGQNLCVDFGYWASVEMGQRPRLL